MFRMSLYAHPHVRKSGSYFGYAYAYYEIEKHLKRYMYQNKKMQIDLNNPKSKIQMYFGSPPGYFFPHQYKIQMTQWESTLVPPQWVDHAKEYDEWWTANKFGADAFVNAGVPKEKIYVYEHGVDFNTWFPAKRGTNNKIRFLHIDSGSPRKRADMVIKAFRSAFGGNMDYELTLKYSHYPQSKVNWFDKDILENHGDWQFSNVRHIRENISLESLVSLFHFHDVLIYPSEGEGFGLIPLQALATGMPVISTDLWCSYSKYFLGNSIDAKLGQSDIVETYQRFGDVVVPNLDSCINKIKNLVNNADQQFDAFFNQIEEIAEEYTWDNQTKKAMDSLVNRVGINMFGSSNSHLKK